MNDNAIQAEVIPELSEKHKIFVKNLRELADFYESRPELKVPSGNIDFYIFYQTLEEAAKVVKLFGNSRKETLGDNYFVLCKDFGSLHLRANWDRSSVCERVVIGQETVEERVPATFTTQTVIRDKVEWRCPKISVPRLENSND